LSELRDKGVLIAATSLARAVRHVLEFFRALRTELGFGLACVRLHRRLTDIGLPVCFPTPVAAGERAWSCRGLYDVSLALTVGGPVVGNDVDADGRRLVVITGANRGGKSTFLRAVGLAQLLMQAGMFVPADAYRSAVADGVLTHYPREEDPGMTSGRLDEELRRMSAVVDRVTRTSMLLFNESFASTNEREGAEIARQVVAALVDSGVRVFVVTHIVALARSWHLEGRDEFLFLRADRRPDGRRTFTLVEDEPLETSYGEDLYRRIVDDEVLAADGAP
jgi:DNA mismatch repair ATPase MutS